MRALRGVLLAAIAAFVVLLVFAAAAAATMPSAIATPSYPWVQPPAGTGTVVIAAPTPQPVSYKWVQPPSWIPISG